MKKALGISALLLTLLLGFAGLANAATVQTATTLTGVSTYSMQPPYPMI